MKWGPQIMRFTLKNNVMLFYFYIGPWTPEVFKSCLIFLPPNIPFRLQAVGSLAPSPRHGGCLGPSEVPCPHICVPLGLPLTPITPSGSHSRTTSRSQDSCHHFPPQQWTHSGSQSMQVSYQPPATLDWYQLRARGPWSGSGCPGEPCWWGPGSEVPSSQLSGNCGAGVRMRRGADLWLWVNHIICMSLGFLLCNMGPTTVPAS